MKHVHWIVLNDGVSERVTEYDVDAVEEARVIDSVLVPMTESQPGSVGGRGSPYWTQGEIGGKYGLIRLNDENAPVADVGVCLHSRAAKGLWRRLLVVDGQKPFAGAFDMPPPAPWCAVRCYAPDMALPTWFDVWTKTIAMALVRREGW